MLRQTQAFVTASDRPVKMAMRVLRQQNMVLDGQRIDIDWDELLLAV